MSAAVVEQVNVCCCLDNRWLTPQLTSLTIMAGIVASTLRRKAMHKKHTVDNRQLVGNHHHLSFL